MNGLRHLAVGAMLLVAAAVPADAADATTVTVSIGERLEPARLTVAVGTSVMWTNDDDERHRVRSRDGATEFDSGNLEPGETFTFVFEAPGDHPYVDEREPEDAAYHGAVTVTDDGRTGSGGGSTDTGDASGTGGGTPSRDAGGASTDVDVAVLDRSFSPASVEASVGASVTWTNRSDREHTVTFRSGGGSDEFGGGGTFTRTFDAPGTFDYLCAIHPEMTGTVTVAGAGQVPSDGATGPDAVDGAATGVEGSLPGTVGAGEEGAATTGDAPSPSVRPETDGAAPATRVERTTPPLGGPLGVVLSFIVGIGAGVAGMRFRR